MDDPPPAYRAPTGPVDAEIVIKYSRFLAVLRPVTSREQVRRELDAIRTAHPAASHHCYAYLIGPPHSGEAAMSDDGEPSGTAGRPIFTVIGHKDIGDVLVVVTRYFGGVKLGAGGLVRAYMAAAESVLSAMTVAPRDVEEFMTLFADFADEQAIRHFCREHGTRIIEVRYVTGVEIDLAVARGVMSRLESFCAERGIVVVATG